MPPCTPHHLGPRSTVQDSPHRVHSTSCRTRLTTPTTTSVRQFQSGAEDPPFSGRQSAQARA